MIRPLTLSSLDRANKLVLLFLLEKLSDRLGGDDSLTNTSSKSTVIGPSTTQRHFLNSGWFKLLLESRTLINGARGNGVWFLRYI